jgi:putative redox protein
MDPMGIKKVEVTAVQKDGFTIEVKSRQHVSIVDQPPVMGGKDLGPTPLEYLFVSLAGCIVTIGHIVAKQQNLPIRNISVRVEGELDTDVLMGKSTAVRAGFTGLKVITTIDGDMSKEEKEKFLHTVDARCPISDNIANITPIELVVE